MTVKELASTPDVGVAPPVFMRGLFGFFGCLVWARVHGRSLAPKAWGPLLWRCAAGVGAVGCYYRALAPDGTDMITAAMLLKTSPLWVALLSPWVIGERLTARVWGALVLGLAGVVLVSVDPAKGWDPEASHFGIFLCVFAGLCSAFAYMSLRKLAATDGPATVVASFSAALALASAPFVFDHPAAIAGWSARTWVVLCVAGVLGTAGQLFLTAAYRFGPAAAVTVAGLSEVGLQGLISITYFGEVPSREALLGGALAMVAGLVASPRVRNTPAPSVTTTSLPTGLVVEGDEPPDRK